MLRYGHVATHVWKKVQNSTNFKDSVIVDGPAGPILVAVSGGGAIMTYKLSGAEDAAVGVSYRPAVDYPLYLADPNVLVLSVDGRMQMVVTGMQGSAQNGQPLDGSGKFGTVLPLLPATLGSDVVRLEAFAVNGQDYLLANRNGSMSLSLFARNGADLVKLGEAAGPKVQTVDGEYTGIDIITVGAATYAYAASAQGNALAVLSVGPDGIAMKGQIGGANTVGIAAPREVAAVDTATGPFLIVSGGESDSLSVFRITATGGLVLADHVVDSGSTRFQAVTAMATAELDGRAFVFVGGGDDGISVLTLDGQGRLILLATIEDSDAFALADVSTIVAHVIDGRISVFVTSATEVGISQFFFDPGTLGVSLVGSGQVGGGANDDILIGTGPASTLSGGAGDDILIAREGVVVLQGGGGADIFLPGHATEQVTIADFDPRNDQIDLSELGYIRSIDQLNIIPTSTGALLVTGPLKIEVQTISGTMLQPWFFTESMFRLAHFANNIDYTDLVEPVTPDPGTPSTPPTNGGPTGGYVPPAPLPPLTVKSDIRYGTNLADRMIVTKAGAMLNGMNGHDLLIGGWDQDLLYGGNGNDQIHGGAGADLLSGGAGNDTLNGQAGHDRIHGGAGYNVLRGGAGDDRIWGHDLTDLIDGDAGNDVILGGAGNDVLRGGAGSDLIFGMEGADKILGGDGHDNLIGRGNRTQILGGNGNDLMRANGSDNILFAEDGNDTVIGGLGADFALLGARDDLAYGRSGADQIFGETGNDTIRGDDGNDRLFGNAGDDRLFGGRGHDFMRGGDGQDVLFGDADNDRMMGENGRDIMDGGFGDDLMWGGADADHMVGGEGRDGIYGEVGRDSLLGGGGNDSLYGGSDNDALDGGAGADLLEGGTGDDQLDGKAGDDILKGGAGNDTLVAGDGHDTLSGSFGADVFVFAPPAGQGGAVNVITDFRSGEDVIDMTRSPGTPVWLGNFTFTGTGGTELRMTELPDRVRLDVDMNGDGRADLYIDILGGDFSPYDLLF
ncbi:calcium-binding protein [Paracoccus sp. S1E-3]|uniref:calcium-binding protein n=1 Tax=Paracoccus sp. S1E-3 TaxID=2756130 RepID=UPI0015EF2F55|nr:calcium-binding protein [Paracoccus sp. S1E-3]MBA4492216.1 calcium-binding protein [Paracoccus sp. S1E-3]